MDEPAEGSHGGSVVEPDPYRIHDGSLYELGRKDPRQHYVFVNLRIGYNRMRYQALGYKPVMGEKGGVYPKVGEVEEGKPVELNGMTLMSCPMERFAAMRKHGDELIDSFDKQMGRSPRGIRDQGGAIASVRGDDGRVILGVAHERDAARLRSEMG